MGEELQSLPNVEGNNRLEVLHYLIHHLTAASNSLASTNEQLKLRELIDIAMTFLPPSNPVGFVRGRSSAASGPELSTETTKVDTCATLPHDLSQNFRSAHMQMKKMILYYMARALKEHPDQCGACLESKSGRIVMTDDHSKGAHWLPVFKIGIGDDEYKRQFASGEAKSVALRLDLENVTTNLRKNPKPFLHLYNEFLPSDPLKLGHTGWRSAASGASAKHPKHKTGVEYSLVGQEINIPGMPDASADHQVGSADPWYLVADAFVVCDGGDLSGGCDCPEGFVRVVVSRVHTSRVVVYAGVAVREAPQSRTELPALELHERMTLFWPADLIVARTKPTRGPKAGAKRKKIEGKVKSEGAGKATSRGKQRDLEALESLQDVMMGTGTSRDVTSVPGLEYIHRRQNPNARQPKKPTT
mmetsp:Transcript_11653/g.32842  ORF Transcript_11653/g.32842 Transcript_11653/m.32842 type:complete len:416 (-) Transcript_11653:1010-2257(-)